MINHFKYLQLNILAMLITAVITPIYGGSVLLESKIKAVVIPASTDLLPFESLPFILELRNETEEFLLEWGHMLLLKPNAIGMLSGTSELWREL